MNKKDVIVNLWGTDKEGTAPHCPSSLSSRVLETSSGQPSIHGFNTENNFRISQFMKQSWRFY